MQPIFSRTETTQLIQEQAYKVIAKHLKKAGLRLEDNLRVSDQGFAVTHKAAAVMKSTGCPVAVPSNKSIAGMGIDRDPFVHPLSDGNEEQLNFWAASSMLISAANGWLPEEKNPSATAQKNINALVSSVAPTVDTKALLESARYSDPSLLKLASLIQQGLERAASSN